jgi:uncharacterized membrane protein (DUF4010 family)
MCYNSIVPHVWGSNHHVLILIREAKLELAPKLGGFEISIFITLTLSQRNRDHEGKVLFRARAAPMRSVFAVLRNPWRVRIVPRPLLGNVDESSN